MDWATEVRPGGLQGKVVDDTLGLVERAVEAVDLVGGDDVGGHAPLELAETLVVGVLEGLEGAHEIVEGGFERVVLHTGSFAVVEAEAVGNRQQSVEWGRRPAIHWRPARHWLLTLLPTAYCHGVRPAGYEPRRRRVAAVMLASRRRSPST